MKKTIFLILLGLMVAAIAVVTSCNNDENRNDDDYNGNSFQVKTTAISAMASAGTYSVAVASPTPWTASVDAGGWCSISPKQHTGNGTITVTLTANPSTVESRSATLTVNTDTLSQKVVVTQAPITLGVNEKPIWVIPASSIYTIPITSSATWTATVNSAATWCVLTSASATGNGDITVSIIGNTIANVPRAGATITVTADSLSRQVYVQQDAYAITFDPPTYAASNTLWVIESRKLGTYQIWSAPIEIPACNKTNFDGGTPEASKADCRNNPGYPGYLYSWNYVYKNIENLCPSPWRIPTYNDYVNLYETLKEIGTYYPATYECYKCEAWGVVYGGYAVNSKSFYRGSVGYYWSFTPGKNYYVYETFMDQLGAVYFDGNPEWKSSGVLMRCVR
jgi:uncharacterized protein (TIGR02145 family)